MSSINHLAGVTPSPVPENRKFDSPSLPNNSGTAPTSPTDAGKFSFPTEANKHPIYGNTHPSRLQSAYCKSSKAHATGSSSEPSNWTALVNRLNELKKKSGKRAEALTDREVQDGYAALEALEEMSQQGVSGPLPEGLNKKEINVETFLHDVFCAMQTNRAVVPQLRRRPDATTAPVLKAKL